MPSGSACHREAEIFSLRHLSSGKVANNSSEFASLVMRDSKTSGLSDRCAPVATFSCRNFVRIGLSVSEDNDRWEALFSPADIIFADSIVGFLHIDRRQQNVRNIRM
jgi:hypothetical protein